MCFNVEDINCSQIGELVKMSRFLGVKLKCLGVFKVKNRKTWKFSTTFFLNTLLFDPIILESRESLLKIIKGGKG